MIEPAAIAARIPDLPRWIDVRGILLSGRVRAFTDDPEIGGVARSTELPFAAIWGTPAADLVRHAVRSPETHFSIEAQSPTPTLRAALDGWREEPILIHRYARPAATLPPTPDGIEVFVGPGDRMAFATNRLLPDIAAEVRVVRSTARPIAAAVEGGEIVSLCYTTFVTDGLWDVSIDTVESHRRRGLATLCFEHLRRALEPRGLAPVWGAHETNVVSRAMAADLGFDIDARLVVWWAGGSRQ